MLKKFISDIAVVQILNLLVKPIWILLIDREVQNQLSQTEYGQYFALFNFSLLFFIILDLGITNFNVTQVSKDKAKLKQLFGDLFGLKLLLAMVYLFVVFTLGSLMGYDSYQYSLLLLLTIVQILTSFNQYFRSSINAFQLFRSEGVFMVLDRLIIIILCALMLWGGISAWGITIERFIYAQIIGLGSVALMLLLFIYRKMEKVSLSFKLIKVLPLLKKTWPYGVLVALMGLYNYADGVMLEKYAITGAEEAGVYAMGYRLFFALFMFAQVFSGVLLSLYGKHDKDKNTLQILSSFTAKLLLIVGIVVAVLSFEFKSEIMEFLYPKKYSNEAAEAFSLLMFSFIGSALILVFGTLLTAKEHLKELNIAAGITLLLNLILNYSLIPEMGAKGAAIATLVSQLLFGISCYFISLFTLRFKYEVSEVIRMLIGLLILFIGIEFSVQYFDVVAVQIVMILMTILITAAVTKIFGQKALKSGAPK